VGATGFEGGDQIAPSPAENKADRASEAGGIPTASRRVADRPGHVATSPGSEPPQLTVDVLRQKLDTAILAEAWDAVKVIRERLVEAERAAAGNVVAIRVAAGRVRLPDR
jgi:hypothetical protein